MKVQRRPQPLLNRSSQEPEEFMALHFPSGVSRDAARRLWRLLEDAFRLDLRGLHPDDDLGEILCQPRGSSAVRQIGSFRYWVEQTENDGNQIGDVEIVMSIDEALSQRSPTAPGLLS